MKHKFSKMGRVAIALVLALSLVLVMGVPVAADVSEPTVALDTYVVSTTAEYTIGFTTTASLGMSSEIYIEFPSDTTVPAIYATADVTIDGNPVSSGDISGSGNVVTITLATGISGGTTVAVVFETAADIVNPTTAGTTYTLDVWTSAAGDSAHVPSATYTIVAAPDTTNPTVSLTAPNGGEIWATGSVQSITWTASDDIDTKLTIKLEYWDGSSWYDITTGSDLVDTSLTAYSWTVGSGDSPNSKVKVTATDDAGNSAYDENDAVFTIDATVPTVAVVLPNGSETWVESSTHNITWTSSATDLATNPIAIYYSTDSGTTWTSVATGEANDGTYSWTLPAVYSTTSKVKVTATDAAGNTGSDKSDADFTIDDDTDPLAVTVVSPDGGESWTVGSTQSITWTGGTDAVDTATSITLEYSNDAGETWESAIATGETNDGTYSWTPPSTVGVNYLVKVTAIDDASNSAYDVSDAVFSIIDPVHNATQDIRYPDIQAALDAAVAGDTINVAPGTYAPSAQILISLAGLTLQSTDGAAVTIIDATSASPGIQINADDVIVDGFTIDDAAGDGIWIRYGIDGATVRNNIINDAAWSGIALIYDDTYPTLIVSGATIANNVISNSGNGIEIAGAALNNSISGNTITGSGRGMTFSGGLDDTNYPTKGNTITGNTITNNSGVGIYVKENTDPAGTLYFRDNLISGNTISGNEKSGIEIEGANNLDITGLVITGNNITGNVLDGIRIGDISTGSDWGPTNVINNNNIYNNAVKDISNGSSIAFADAENNWWGQVGGPEAGQTSGLVDYTPWLNAAYSEPVAPVTTIELSEGWNLISLPLYITPANRAPATLLAAVENNINIVWGNYDPAAGVFESYIPGSGGDLTAMSDGKGYWVDMAAADTLDISALGTELPDAPAAPPTYDVVAGWNLIGFKSTTTKTASTYLAAIAGDYTMIYGFANGVYFAVQSADNLEPGYGYWIAVTEPGTIYP